MKEGRASTCLRACPSVSASRALFGERLGVCSKVRPWVMVNRIPIPAVSRGEDKSRTVMTLA